MGLKSQIVDRGPRLLAEAGPRTALRRGPVDRGPRGRGPWTAEPLETMQKNKNREIVRKISSPQ